MSCEHCQGPIDRTTRPRSRWCSETCRHRAHSRVQYASPEQRARQREQLRNRYATDPDYRARKIAGALASYRARRGTS